MRRAGGVRMSSSMRWFLLLLIESSMCFKFVYIPCEPGMPMEEWELFPKKGDDEISCLTVHLQKWFSKSGRLSDDQKAQLKEQVKLHAQKKNLTVDNVFENSTISDDILQTESVEIITLLPPMQEHGYVSGCLLTSYLNQD